MNDLSLESVIGVAALLIHAVAPRFFTNTASNVMRNILESREK